MIKHILPEKNTLSNMKIKIQHNKIYERPAKAFLRKFYRPTSKKKKNLK